GAAGGGLYRAHRPPPRPRQAPHLARHALSLAGAEPLTTPALNAKSCRLLDRRKRRRLQEHAFDVGQDWAIALAIAAGGDPRRVGLKGGPLLLALGHRFPGQQVV